MPEYSFGIIPLRQSPAGWETLLVCHRKGHFWAFPKGHAEEGETPKETACREFFEETGLTVVRFISDQPLHEHYFFTRAGKSVEKHVKYYLAEIEGEVSLQQEEIEAVRWVKLEEAEEIATFEEAKTLCRQLLQHF